MDGPTSDTNLQPEPARKPRLYQVTILFAYHVLLGLMLAYFVYNVWPPLPWPGDRPKELANSNRNSNDNSNAQPNRNTNANGNAEASPSPRGGTSPAGANTNAGTGANANSAPATSNANSATGSSSTTGTGNNTSSAGNASNTQPQNIGASDKEKLDNPYGGDFPPKFTVMGREFRPTLEVRLILLVMLVGAIGSYIHAASSFVDYLGNRSFVSSWVWWYLLRPFIGMLLALLFYFVFRGGFITAGVNSSGEAATNYINPFGIAALAGLVGMFSKVATDKLNEVFTTLFRPAPGQGDAKRGDKLGPPTITKLDPPKGPAGTAVTITGANFGATVTVLFDKTPSRSVKVNSATSIIAVAPPHAPGTVDVEVSNPDGQHVSLPDGFTYVEAPGQQPPQTGQPPAGGQPATGQPQTSAPPQP